MVSKRDVVSVKKQNVATVACVQSKTKQNATQAGRPLSKRAEPTFAR